jgi:hypothetical protein
MKGMHPAFAAALAPFAPSAANDPVVAVLQGPYEIEVDDEGHIVEANRADLTKAVDELLDAHRDELDQRVLALTLNRAQREAEEARIDRYAA